MAVRISRYAVTDTFVVSHTEDPDGAEVEFTRKEFVEFLQAVKRGELDKDMEDKQEAP